MLLGEPPESRTLLGGTLIVVAAITATRGAANPGRS